LIAAWIKSQMRACVSACVRSCPVFFGLRGVDFDANTDDDVEEAEEEVLGICKAVEWFCTMSYLFNDGTCDVKAGLRLRVPEGETKALVHDVCNNIAKIALLIKLNFIVDVFFCSMFDVFF
jgi:hypothetical protein